MSGKPLEINLMNVYINGKLSMIVQMVVHYNYCTVVTTAVRKLFESFHFGTPLIRKRKKKTHSNEKE